MILAELWQFYQDFCGVGSTYYFPLSIKIQVQFENIHRKSKRAPEKQMLLLYWLCQSLWLCGSITINCGKFWNRWEYQTTWPASWEICMQVRKQQLELDVEQQTGSKWEMEYVKAVYCHPAYLTYMQSTSWETLGWRSTSWNQDCQEKYQ